MKFFRHKIILNFFSERDSFGDKRISIVTNTIQIRLELKGMLYTRNSISAGWSEVWGIILAESPDIFWYIKKICKITRKMIYRKVIVTLR